MTRDLSYIAVMGRRNAIMQESLGLDYEEFITSPIAFVAQDLQMTPAWVEETAERVSHEE